MIYRSLSSWAVVLLFLLPEAVPAGEGALRETRDGSAPNRATIHVHAGERSFAPIPKEITGKFAEHLGFNIYHGMSAQILHNPTFAEYPFWNGRMTPDGVTEFQVDETKIADELRGQARRFGWPDTELADLVRARADALACFWTRVGGKDDVQFSPDTGPYGGRAQRVQVKKAGQGIAQWTWLPLHRQRQFEFEVMARSFEVKSLSVSLSRGTNEQPFASACITPLSTNWQTYTGRLVVPSDSPAEDPYRLTVTADTPGQFVVRHVFLRPADAIQGADPDVVRFLRESHLPILRWPGGNFVSTYHWEDGIGPVEQRPTRPNYAWGAIEPNTFGTDEFMAFCQAVGCEPMICINAGSGTPEEAARWIEYCNGPASSAMGRLRAAQGHAEPFHVKYWEVGNELWGHWQMRWTTAAGYVDRFKQFSAAMMAADPSIKLYACGAPAMSGKAWNDTLITGAGASLHAITDHPLIGGGVSPAATPLEVYRDFMAVPEVLQQKWSALRDDMRHGGVESPSLAVTELQLFAHIARPSDTNVPVHLTWEQFPGQGSITEAIYDVLIYHAAIRLTPFVEMVTHSATVNHGGGLRKEHEHVWANPCYYAQSAFAAFAGAIPVPIEIESAVEEAPMVLPDLKNASKNVSFRSVDALAAMGGDGGLLLSIVNRSSSNEPFHITVDIQDFKPANEAELRTLAADAPWDGNSLDQPARIHPVDSSIPLRDGKLELDVKPFSVLRVRLPRG
jgi:alpha-N-arabinofuranosidase